MCIEENWKYESTPAIPIQQVHLATKMSGTTTQVLILKLDVNRLSL